MICPVCHGNGYVRRRGAAFNRLIKFTRFRVPTHMNCQKCNAQGEIHVTESSNTGIPTSGAWDYSA